MAAFLFALPTLAQESRGSIAGRVTDTSGAVVPDAAVAAVNQATNVTVRVKSNNQGDYQILFLNPGQYKVTAGLAGFKTFEKGPIEVRVNDRLLLDVTLEVGDIGQKIEVSAETPLLEAASANVGQVVDNRRVAELPLLHGSSKSLFLMVPGASNTMTSILMYQDPSRPGTSADIRFSGTPIGTTEFTLDGVPNTQTANSDAGRMSISNQPPADAIQELKVETAYDASVGHTSGAHINMVIKSGTNDAHGTIYFFYRNPGLNANSFFGNRSGQTRADFDYKRGGGSFLGPVWIPKLYNGKNRTFFMYAYEVMDEFTNGYPFIGTVPTAAERTGDLSALLKVASSYQIYDPASTAPAANGRFSRQPFPGNIIPANRISPIGQAIFKYYPASNIPGSSDGTNNYAIQNLPTPNIYQDHIARIDHVVNDKDRMYARYSQYFKVEGPYRDYFRNGATGNNFVARPYNLVLDDIYTPTPRLVIDVRYGFQRFPCRHAPVSQGFDLASLGFTSTMIGQLGFRNPVARLFPNIQVSGMQTLQQEAVDLIADDSHSFFVDINRPIGAHSLKFGADLRLYRKNTYSFGNATPSFVFSTAYTNGPLDNSPAASGGIGQGLAALLLGQPTGGSVDYNDSSALQSPFAALYIHDDWRLSSKLTLNLGLRYEYEGPITDRYNRSVRGFDPQAELPIAAQVQANYAARPIAEIPAGSFRVRGGGFFAGVNGQPNALYDVDRANLMPRVGFAYSVFHSTVIRGGYGIFFLETGIPAGVSTYPQGYNQTTPLTPSLDNGLTFRANLANPFPDGIQTPTGNRLGPMTYVGNSISFFSSSVCSPYNQRWNLNVQQLLPGRFLLEVGYAGSRATRLLTSRDLNALPNVYLSTLPVRDNDRYNRLSSSVPNPFYPLLPGTSTSGATVSVSRLLSPYPQFGSMTMRTNQGYLWYHGLQLRAERRFARGFTYILSYTYSKLMEATSFLNPADPVPYRSISLNDQPHHISMSGIYELPFGKGRRWLASAPAPLRHLISGWQTTAVYQQWNGQPLGFGDFIYYGDTSSIVLPPGQRTVERWFNTDGFERNVNRQFVSHYRTAPLYFSNIRADTMHTLDLSVLKYTNLTEKVKFQFRAEAFNALNHPTFGTPNTTPSSSAFGQSTSEINFTRQVQFGFKLMF